MALVLSVLGHGALFALGEFSVEALPDRHEHSAAEAPADADRASPALQVVALRPTSDDAYRDGDAAPAASDGPEVDPSPAPATPEFDRPAFPRTRLADAARPVEPSTEPVEPRAAAVRLADLRPDTPADRDPAAAAFRARMEARADNIDYRAASRAAREAEDGEGTARRGVRGRIGGSVGPGCDAPGVGGTDRSPFPVGAGPRR